MVLLRSVCIMVSRMIVVPINQDEKRKGRKGGREGKREREGKR
jgi:hypothetical protein